MQDALEVPAFSGSEEAQVAEGLLDAYRTGDAEAVRQFVASHSLFLELDNQVSYPSLCCAGCVLGRWPGLICIHRQDLPSCFACSVRANCRC